MVSCAFYCGTVPVPVGVTDVTVSGLVLRFTPGVANVTVRQPSADAPLISAYVTGSLAADGFTATLSAPAAIEGYVLEYTIFSEGGVAPIAGDTLAVSYDELKTAVAKFLGYDPSVLSESQTAEVDSYIQSGVRNFYYPPKTIEGIDENFEWSFIRQNGTVNTTAATDSYTLPDGFGRIAGQIAVRGEDCRTIPIVPYGDVVRMRGRAETGRPRVAAVTSESSFGTRGQLKRIHLYPTPDREYALDFVCDSDTGKLDADERPFPLGGAMFSELVIESCLAVAEQRANDEEGLHTKKFCELIVSSIARDRKSSAQTFGDIGDPDVRRIAEFRPLATRGFLY